MDATRTSAIPGGTGHRDVRRNNLEVVLRHLSVVGPDSRASIAERSGLTRSTVSRLVTELIDLGLVRETGAHRAHATGRPATALELDGRHVLAIGAEVNVDYLAVLVTDLAKREIYQRRKAFDAGEAGPERGVTELAALCRQALDTLAERPHPRPTVVAGLTVAVPGLVDVHAGTVLFAPNLRWTDFPAASRLRELLALGPAPVSIGNDANLAAMAEYHVGVHAGVPDLVYITGEVGIGGGVVVEGNPLLGARGLGGEVGHMKLDPNGPECGCGRRGCWEAMIGLRAVLRALDQRDEDDRQPPEAKVAVIANQARAGDPSTLNVLADVGRWIGIGAANLVNIFNPSAIILGGYFTILGDWILPSATRTLAEGTLAHNAGGCVLTTSSLGFTAAARGGAIHAAEQIVSRPTLLAGA